MSASQAFDDYASTYDVQFSDTLLGKTQRDLIWQTFSQYLQKNTKVLELNCGTGVDAFVLANTCATVLATDISEGMIAMCKEKLKTRPLANLSFQTLDIRHLEQVLPRKYDFILSNFAGLNCVEPDALNSFAKDSARLCNTGAQLVLVFLGKKCLWEKLYFRLKNDPRKNRRSNQQGTVVQLRSQSIRTWYYEATAIKKMFDDFEVLKCRAIGLVVPPAFMERHFKQRPFLLKTLVVFEKLLCHFPRFADYGDHFVLVLRKK